MKTQLLQKIFTKILVPVDFTRQSKNTIQMAVKIAMQYECGIQLLNVYTEIPFNTDPLTSDYYVRQRKHRNTQNKMRSAIEKMCDQISDLSKTKVAANYRVLPGTWNEVIVDTVKRDQFDLVLVSEKCGQNGKNKAFLNTTVIASESDIPVITLPEKWEFNNINSVIIPVTDFLPTRKLIYGMCLAAEFKTKIKLLGIAMTTNIEKVNYYLHKSNSFINENCKLNVDTIIVYAGDIEKAVNKAAITRADDFLVLDTGTITRNPGFFEKPLRKIFKRYSTPPILTVNLT